MAEYPVAICAGETFTGATTLHFVGIVDEATGKVSGHAQITAMRPPVVDVFIAPVTGQVHHLGFGGDKRIVTLCGHYSAQVGPLEVPLEVRKGFSAVLDLDPSGAWRGEGSFSYGSEHVDNVPVRPVP